MHTFTTCSDMQLHLPLFPNLEADHEENALCHFVIAGHARFTKPPTFFTQHCTGLVRTGTFSNTAWSHPTSAFPPCWQGLSAARWSGYLQDVPCTPGKQGLLRRLMLTFPLHMLASRRCTELAHSCRCQLCWNPGVPWVLRRGSCQFSHTALRGNTV